MITLKKIKVFDSFNGDDDSYFRTERSHHEILFEDNEWALIGSFYQDIVLVNNGLTTETYVEQVIANLREHSDKESFETLVGKINFYKDFQNIAGILIQIKSYISSDSDMVWAGYDNADQFIEELNKHIQYIQNCSFIVLSDIHVNFLPTCTYQEISISNGWSDEYINLSNKFDKIYTLLIQTKAKPNTSSTINRPWWRKLLFKGM